MRFTDLSPEELNSYPDYDDHQTLRRFVLDEDKGIIAYIAVHNTNLGPGLGGCRIYPYESEALAIKDALRLARGMSYKNALAGLPLGGGKSVIIANARTDKTPQLMERFGAAVETLQGDYVTAEDSGSTEEDMECISNQTSYVTGLDPKILQNKGYADLGGNPSPYTAMGCFYGVKRAVEFRNGSDDLNGLKAAIQGVGAVGLALAKLLQDAGVTLSIADISEENLECAKQILGADVTIVAPDVIHAQDVDIYAPCAMGGALNDSTIPDLKAWVVAGAANNQLAELRHGDQLAAKDVLYVPDYVLNSGGVICVGYEYFMTGEYNPYDFEMSRDAMTNHVEAIGQTVFDILTYAKQHGLNTATAADTLGYQRIHDDVPVDVPGDVQENVQAV